MSSIRFMSAADLLARNNSVSGDGNPFGAVIVRDDMVVGQGKDTTRKDKDPTAHAVINALHDAQQNEPGLDFSKCEIYVSSYPCAMCMAAIATAGIAKVYYGNTRQEAEEIGFTDSKLLEFVLQARKTGAYAGGDGMPEVNQGFKEFAGNTLASFDNRAKRKVARKQAERKQAEEAEREKQAKLDAIKNRSHFAVAAVANTPIEKPAPAVAEEPVQGDAEEVPEDLIMLFTKEESRIDPTVEFEETDLFSGPPPVFTMPD